MSMEARLVAKRRRKKKGTRSNTTSIGLLSQSSALLAGASVIVPPLQHLKGAMTGGVPADRALKAATDSVMNSFKKNWQLFAIAGGAGVARTILNKKKMNPKIFGVKGLFNAKLF